MKEIPLTRGLTAKVSDEDFSFLNQFKWQAVQSGKDFYARRSVRKGATMTYEIMHRVIATPLPNMVVDHINHDPLDNRRENLRVVTQEQNLANRANGKRVRYKGEVVRKIAQPKNTLSFTCSPELNAKLIEEARVSGLSVAAVIKRSLSRYFLLNEK